MTTDLGIMIMNNWESGATPKPYTDLSVGQPMAPGQNRVTVVVHEDDQDGGKMKKSTRNKSPIGTGKKPELCCP